MTLKDRLTPNMESTMRGRAPSTTKTFGKGRLVRSVEAALGRLRRWIAGRMADERSHRPYGEPPFPFTLDQWEDFCRNEEGLRGDSTSIDAER